ncbi:MAG: tetratricopeptide repeat protein, partial [Candidatus Zixiibacteriota bacterium]
MRAKVKITKQQIKEDKFTTFVLRAKDRIVENWQVVSIAAAAAIIIIAGFVYYVNTQSSREATALNRLTRATAELQRRNYEAAITEFQAVADSYGGDAAGRAQFYLGNAYYGSKDYDEAIAAFQKYVDKYHLDKLSTSSAMAGIAASLENKQEFATAAERYREAVDYYPDSPSAPDYYLGAVRCYVQTGNRELAEQMVAVLKERYFGSDYYRTASQLAMQLNVE